jgi:hypothetical protein
MNFVPFSIEGGSDNDHANTNKTYRAGLRHLQDVASWWQCVQGQGKLSDKIGAGWNGAVIRIKHGGQIARLAPFQVKIKKEEEDEGFQ